MTSTTLKRSEFTTDFRAHEAPVRQQRDEIPGRLNFGHLDRMLTPIGIWQHTQGSKPDRNHGYSIDDQARGLVVALGYYKAGIEPGLMERLGSVTFDFLDRAAIGSGSDAGRFHNFCDENGVWLDPIGSDDSLGRTVWALGVTASQDAPFAPAAEAKRLLQASLPHTDALVWLRSIAFSVIGLAAAGTERDRVANLADKLVAAYDRSAKKDWQWFEDSLTYCNARLPMALFLASEAFPERAHYREIAEDSLEFLLRATRNRQGSYSPIGNEPMDKGNWFTARHQAPPIFDQQPVEAGALVECCASAYRVTADPRYRRTAEEAFGWYLGRNCNQVAVYDHATGGVADAIVPQGISKNMGAESVVSVHLAKLALDSM